MSGGPRQAARAAGWLRVLTWSVRNGLQDAATIYTLRTWLGGWFLRVVAQVLFFALVGRLLGSAGTVRELLIGNATALTALGAHTAVASTTWERRAGTLPLLLAAPANPLLVLAGRSLNWLLDGTASAYGSFLIVGPLLGLTPRPADLAWLLLLLPLAAVGSYCLALFLGALVLRAMDLRNLIMNLATFTTLAFCGVNVPVAFFPSPIRWLAAGIPFTHMLRAVRAALAGAPTPTVAADALVGMAVALCWLVVALIAFDRLERRGRQDGSIEFND